MIKTQFIAKMVNGKPQIYATAQKDNGAPVYIFQEEETFDAAVEAHMIPVGALIVKTYDAIEMAGGPFDAELGDSENAPQNKAVYSEINALKDIFNEAGHVLISYNPTQITTVVGQGYHVCELELPEGKWLLIGQTLAVGDQYIDGADYAPISRNYSIDGEKSLFSFAISAGNKIVSISVSAQVQPSTIHNDGNFVRLTAVKIGNQ